MTARLSVWTLLGTQSHEFVVVHNVHIIGSQRVENEKHCGQNPFRVYKYTVKQLSKCDTKRKPFAIR